MNWILKHPTVLLIGSLALVLAGAVGVVVWWVIRPVNITVPDTLPDDFPAAGFAHASFERLLERFVDREGQVDYAAWSADASAATQLDRYLAALARYSPTNAPDRFPTEADQLAYWLNAYNACVIKGVLRHWPLKSVRDVKAPIDVVSGLAFFAKLRFSFGGERMSLHVLEQELIRKRFPDPRIHFVLNCASGGCPRLRPQLPEGPELEAYLTTSARDFVADDQNVRIDHAAKTVHFSQIFNWYREDFTSELERRGLPPAERTLLAYAKTVATGERLAELERAADYAEAFTEYDWGINDQ